MLHSICDVPGIRLGHSHDESAKTGCTVILPDQPATAGVDVRGSAPGSREIEVLKPVRLVQKLHGILLTGGSAFGLNAAGGVQKYLEERGIGFDVGVTKVPIVPTAVIFDLSVGSPWVRPTPEMAYQTCLDASATEQGEGRIGAGCGATIGKIRGQAFSMFGGIGMASWRQGDLVVGALVVLNCLGDVVDPKSGKLIAGARSDEGGFLDTVTYVKTNPEARFSSWENTVLAVVASNASFARDAVTKIAQMAQDGIAQAIRPSHTPFDGDMVFAISTGEVKAEVLTVGSVAAELVAEAIVRAAKAGNGLQ